MENPIDLSPVPEVDLPSISETTRPPVPPSGNEQELVPVEAPPVAEENAQWLESRLPALIAFLAKEPGARADIERILQEHLKGSPTADTGGALLAAMQRYAGMEEGDFLLTILMRGFDDRELYELFVSRLEPGDHAWARLMLAVYGKRVSDVWLVSGEIEDDWRTLTQQIIYSKYADRWQIRTNLLKYNGENLFFESRLDTYVNLLSLLFGPLRDLPQEVIETSLDMDRLLDITSTCVHLMEAINGQGLRQQLVDAIMDVPGVDQLKVRSHWLAGMPKNIYRYLHDPEADVKAMVEQVNRLGKLESGRHAGETALLVLIDRVLEDVEEGSDAAEELLRIRDELVDNEISA